MVLHERKDPLSEYQKALQIELLSNRLEAREFSSGNLRLPDMGVSHQRGRLSYRKLAFLLFPFISGTATVGYVALQPMYPKGAYASDSAKLPEDHFKDANVRIELASPTPPIEISRVESQSINIPWMPESVTQWKDLFIAASKRHAIDPEFLAIITLVESVGKPNALSPAGAVGLMQVMPGTGADIARSMGIQDFNVDKLYDPAYAIDFGAYYLSQQLNAFGLPEEADPDWQQSIELAAAAYNGGPGSAQRYLKDGSLPTETRNYKHWVGGMWRERHDQTSPTFEAWQVRKW